ncbi:hypothetical protein KUV57_11380 [Epibacterium sp. DP7N7-1]|nr:hypothetical protein [Epibacterium sp. DP7N7-1]
MSRRHIKNQAIAWVRRNGEVEYFDAAERVQIYARLGARRIRITDYTAWSRKHGDSHIGDKRDTVIEIGDLDFDRWANSVLLSETFDPQRPAKAQINELMARADRMDPPRARA